MREVRLTSTGIRWFKAYNPIIPDDTVLESLRGKALGDSLYEFPIVWVDGHGNRRYDYLLYSEDVEDFG